MPDRGISRRHFLQTAGTAAGGILFVGPGLRATSPVANTLVIRKEIRSLNDDEVKRLRNAFQQLQAKPGSGGYQDQAGIHGLPQYKCKHHTPTWLPWHRAYILNFENALRQFEPTVSLPFWDWTSAASIQNGIPDSFAVAQYEPTPGNPVPNPLFSAAVGPESRTTSRSPLPPANLTQIADEVQAAFTDNSFLVFSEDVATPHDNLHGWVGGDMGVVDYSAYDPLFWAHHANVDRIWAQWQLGTNNQDPPANVLQSPLDPFGTTVAQVINYRKDLNYDYDGITPMPPTQIVKAAVETGDVFKFKRAAANIKPGARVILHVHGLEKVTGSFRLHIFVNQPEATARTSLAENTHYAGTISLFGTAHPAQMAEHHGFHGKPTDQRSLDITDLVEKLVKPGEEITIKIVATDMTGKPVDVSKLPIAGITLDQ